MPGRTQDGSSAARYHADENDQQQSDGDKPVPESESCSPDVFNLANSGQFALGEVVFDGGSQLLQSPLARLQLGARL